MMFKLRYDKSINKLKVNCLSSRTRQNVSAGIVTDHIYYDIPNELAPQIQAKLESLITTEMNTVWDDLEERQRRLIKERRESMIKLTNELNPKIFHELENFKSENPELFI